MPVFRESDPRHPHNRIRLIWKGWEENERINQEIPIGIAWAQLKRVLGINSKAMVHQYLEDMADFGVIEWERGEWVKPLPNGLQILD